MDGVKFYLINKKHLQENEQKIWIESNINFFWHFMFHTFWFLKSFNVLNIFQEKNLIFLTKENVLFKSVHENNIFDFFL